MLLATHLRAPGPRDRPRRSRRRWRRRSRRAISDGPRRDLIATRHRRLPRRRTSTRACCASSPAAGRRRQVHADRPAAVRLQADLRGPARRAGARLASKSARTGGDIDFALLVDGLAAEREQGITIDVAYRFFATERRKFIVADTPGHEQYTRNMVDRRLDRRPRGHPDRRAQGRADADPPPQLSSCRCSASATSCWRSTRWTWSTTTQSVVRRASSSDYRAFAAAARASPTSLPSRCRRCYGDNVIERSARRCPGTTARRCSSTWRRVEVDDDRAEHAVPHAGAVGQPAQPRLPRLRRHDRRRRRASRATTCACCPRARETHGRAHRHRRRRPRPRRVAGAVGHADARRRDRRHAAAT